MTRHRRLRMAAVAAAVGLLSIRAEAAGQYDGKKLCFLYPDRSIEFWTMGLPLVFKEFRDRGLTIDERLYNNDANKQLEQTHDCISQHVDGISIFPADGESALAIVAEANKAGVPIALYNRPPAKPVSTSIEAYADNYSISVSAMEAMTALARKLGRKVTPLIMVGDLGDPNAVERRRGFMDVVAKNSDLYNKPVEVPTKWNAAVALANLQNALQANPDIDLVFTSSEFLYPQVQGALEPIGKWNKVGDADHIIMGGIDGFPTACRLIRDGYADVSGVQNLMDELKATIDLLLKASVAGDKMPHEVEVDRGITLTAANFTQDADKMWGCAILKAKGEL